jgi:adenylate cyclase
MGDCIMAFWGAPVRDDSHALKGVQAALAMQQTLKRLQPAFQEKYQSEIRIGIGLNTGRMSVGNMGSRIRVAYTVMGDAVNLASRLESLTKEYGADIIVGEGTKGAVENVVFRELDRVRVKGKGVAVAIYEPVGLVGAVQPAVLTEIGMFHEALQHYRSQKWEPAIVRLHELRAMTPDSRLYTLFLERIERLRAHPPGADWDGAFTFENK